LQGCADAWPTDITQGQTDQGAELIINAATWPPGKYGPGDTWLKRSVESGLPIFVANRTGVEQDFDIREAESVVAYQGQYLLQHSGPTPALIVVDWSTEHRQLQGYQVLELPLPKR